MKKQLLALTVAAAFIAPSTSFALDSSFDAQSMAGDHQFYVWCTGKDDYEATETGDNAAAAQAALAEKAGANCWPVWQGKN